MPNINTKFTLSGEKEYKAALSQIGDGMRVLDSEMRKVSSAYAGNATSVEALTAKNDVLERKISTQTERIETLKAALQQSAEKYGEADKRTMQWQASLNNAEADLNKLNNEFEENKKKIEESGEGLTGLGDIVNGLTQKFGIQLPDSAKTSMNAMGSVNTSALALAGGLAAVATAIAKVEKAMIDMTKESAAFADNIITLSMQTGQTTDQLQEFSYATELIDVSVDTLQGSLRKLTNNMQDTMNGTGNAKASFEALGVSVTNADGSMRSANDVFYDTIDALGQVKNETERDAMSMDIFGRSAQDLNPLIIQGSETLKAYAEEAHNMGYVLDDEALSALGAVDDAYQRLQKTQEGVKNQLAVEFAPYLKEFYEEATKGIKNLGDAVKNSGIVDAAGMLLQNVTEIIAPMNELSNSGIPKLTEALRPLAEILALISDAGELFSGLLDFSSGHIKSGWNKTKHALGFGYESGDGNNYQKLHDSFATQDWGVSDWELTSAYETAVKRGDETTLGITEDEWKRRYVSDYMPAGASGTNFRNRTGNASGTDNWFGGFTRVNENGPERIYLPSGSRIQTASETRYTTGDTYNVTVCVDHVDELADIVRIAKNARITTRMGAR